MKAPNEYPILFYLKQENQYDCARAESECVSKKVRVNRGERLVLGLGVKILPFSLSL